MYLITFRPDTRRITSAGVINPTYALTTLPGIGQSAAQVIHNVDERAGK